MQPLPPASGSSGVPVQVATMSVHHMYLDDVGQLWVWQFGADDIFDVFRANLHSIDEGLRMLKATLSPLDRAHPRLVLAEDISILQQPDDLLLLFIEEPSDEVVVIVLALAFEQPILDFFPLWIAGERETHF